MRFKGISQRAVVENILSEHLHTFVEDELSKLESGGVLTAWQRAERERELKQPIEQWTPKQKSPDEALSLLGLLKKLLS